MKRIGLLGGAFNPPHEGHLKLARLALAHLDLDELRFVPAALPPHKPAPDAVTDAQRLRLLEAAVEGLDPRARVTRLELERGGISYTVDTLETLHEREPDAVWIIIIGSDQLPGLPRWHRADGVFRLASIAVAERPGQPIERLSGLPLKASSLWSGAPGELVRLPSTELDLASSALRDDLCHNRTTTGLPGAVSRLIRAENLYK